MMGFRQARYNELVRREWWRGALVTLVASLCCLSFAAPAGADEEFDVGPSPVININGGRGQVTIQTWDRPQVLIASEKPTDVRHLTPDQVDSRIPKQFQMPAHVVNTDHGPVTLDAESFVLPELSGAPHDAIVARGNGRMTIMIPRGTAMVIAHLRAGRLAINDYHGVFIAHVRGAEVSLNHVGGTGYVESLRGRIVATDSSFERLRARTATGDMLFRGCTSHQIQANSTYGSIVYDNGDFQPGLARFESEHGNVALGVRGNAQIGAHSGAGHVESSFRDDAQVRGDPATKQATVGNGGPVVTATSKNGSVYLYSGSMNDHPHVRQELSGSTQLPIRPTGQARQPARPGQPPG